MSAKSRATQHRQWAANALVTAMQSTSLVERETLLTIARLHLARAQKIERVKPPVPRRRSPDGHRGPPG